MMSRSATILSRKRNVNFLDFHFFLMETILLLMAEVKKTVKGEIF